MASAVHQLIALPIYLGIGLFQPLCSGARAVPILEGRGGSVQRGYSDKNKKVWGQKKKKLLSACDGFYMVVASV